MSNRATRRPRRAVKALGLLIALCLLAVTALVVSLSVERRLEVTLPVPTGPFGVGRAIFDWKDDATIDPVAPAPGTKRELLVWIWYPADGGSSAALDDYVPTELQHATGRRGSSLMTLLTRDLSKVRAHSFRNPDMSPRAPSYPVVIMRTGASLGVLTYSALAEDLASQGYVVVGFDAPYRTGVVAFPDGRVFERTPENNPETFEGQPHADRLNKLLAAWTADMGFVLGRLARLTPTDDAGRFAGRLDLTRVGVFGHSFGGAQTAQFCHDDARCKAGIDIDGLLLGSVVQGGLRQPFMFLFSDQATATDPESTQIKADIQSVYDRLPPDARVRAMIRGASHFLFSDDGALLKSHIVLGMLRTFGVVGIDGRRQLAVTSYCVRTFFDRYLKSAGNGPLDLASPLYPELRFLN
ncbi:MAG TPA: hypothetical protein VLT86_06610 [Vicinamibacterales bacterium]|nr:hypothetical protein [Vicinamibacterales bacterium]